jgi:hypothetical protein
MIDEPKIEPAVKAYLAVFPGAIAILTTQGKVVLCPTVARLIAAQLKQAADRAEHHSQDGAFNDPRSSNIPLPFHFSQN